MPVVFDLIQVVDYFFFAGIERRGGMGRHAEFTKNDG